MYPYSGKLVLGLHSKFISFLTLILSIKVTCFSFFTYMNYMHVQQDLCDLSNFHIEIHFAASFSVLSLRLI